MVPPEPPELAAFKAATPGWLTVRATFTLRPAAEQEPDLAKWTEPQHYASGVETVAAEDEPGDDPLDPLSEVRAKQFSDIQAQLGLLDPASPNAASISAPGWVPTEEDGFHIEGVLSETIDAIPNEIASGHAGGGKTDLAFEAMINETIRNPSDSGALRNGRSFYYDRSRNFIVIEDSNSHDGGTAFHPATKAKYLTKDTSSPIVWPTYATHSGRLDCKRLPARRSRRSSAFWRHCSPSDRERDRIRVIRRQSRFNLSQAR